MLIHFAARMVQLVQKQSASKLYRVMQRVGGVVGEQSVYLPYIQERIIALRTSRENRSHMIVEDDKELP